MFALRLSVFLNMWRAGEAPEVEPISYFTLGCWKDTSDRAIQTLEGKDAFLDGSDYTARTNAIKKCARAAQMNGFTVFAVQVK